MGIDVYIGGCLKWLCGGPGAAFLWIEPEVRDRLEPRLTGWMAQEDPFAFETKLVRRDDAWRFLHGTPNIPALYAARPGLEIVQQVGIEAIRAKSLRQTATAAGPGRSARAIAARLRAIPPAGAGRWRSTSSTATRSRRALKSLDILCDYRPGAGIRFSPHFYNRDVELDAAIAAIVEIRATGAWRAFATKHGTVT